MGIRSSRGRLSQTYGLVRLGTVTLVAVTLGAVLPSGLAQAVSDWPTAICGPQVNGSVMGCTTIASVGGSTSLVTIYVATTELNTVVTSFEIFTPTEPTNVVPSACTADSTPMEQGGVTYFAIQCNEKIEPGSSAQVCFDGGGFTGDAGNGEPSWAANPSLPTDAPEAYPVAAVSTCTASDTSGSGGGKGSPGTKRCVVPNVRGDTASSAEHAIVRAGCKVGTLAHIRSTRAHNGIVISQSPRPGSSGLRVSLRVGKA
jgi:hypothetical protein